MNLRLKKERALTLLEVIISIGIFTFVALAVSVVFNSSLQVYQESTNRQEATQLAQTAMEWLVRDIQSASSISEAYTDKIYLKDAEENIIDYYLDAAQALRRQENDLPNPGHLVAEEVPNFSLRYYDIDNNELIPNPIDGLSPTDLASVRNVEISITTAPKNQEFKLYSVAMVEQTPAPPGGCWQYSVVKILSGSPPSDWQAINLSPYGVSGRSLVLLKIKATSAVDLAVRPAGDSHSYIGQVQGGTAQLSLLQSDEMGAMATVTNASGSIEWRGGFFNSSVDLWLLGFTTGCCQYSGAQILTGATPPSSWQAINLSSYVGGNNALVVLKASASLLSSFSIRPAGDPDLTNHTGSAFAAYGTAEIFVESSSSAGMLVIETNASGVIEWKRKANSGPVNMWLLGFIAAGWQHSGTQILDNAPSTFSWQTINLSPYGVTGQKLVLLKIINQSSVSKELAVRPRGDGNYFLNDDYENTATAFIYFEGSISRGGTLLIQTDDTGSIEWRGDGPIDMWLLGFAQ